MVVAAIIRNTAIPIATAKRDSLNFGGLTASELLGDVVGSIVVIIAAAVVSVVSSILVVVGIGSVDVVDTIAVVVGVVVVRVVDSVEVGVVVVGTGLTVFTPYVTAYIVKWTVWASMMKPAVSGVEGKVIQLFVVLSW